MLDTFTKQVLARLAEEEGRYAERVLSSVMPHLDYAERVGVIKGLRKAAEVINDSLKQFTEEPDEPGELDLGERL